MFQNEEKDIYSRFHISNLNVKLNCNEYRPTPSFTRKGDMKFADVIS